MLLTSVISLSTQAHKQIEKKLWLQRDADINGQTMQSVSSGVCYIVAQCLGGIFGAAGAFYSLPGQQ